MSAAAWLERPEPEVELEQVRARLAQYERGTAMWHSTKREIEGLEAAVRAKAYWAQKQASTSEG